MLHRKIYIDVYQYILIYYYYHTILEMLLWGSCSFVAVLHAGAGKVGSTGVRRTLTTLYSFLSAKNGMTLLKVTSCSQCFLLQVDSFNIYISIYICTVYINRF